MHASVAFIIDIAGAKQRSALAAADRPFSSIHSTAGQMVLNRYGYRGRTYAFLLVLTIASGSKNSIRRVPPAVCPSSSTSVSFGRRFGYAQPLAVVENALVLACARRLARPADAAPLGVIRSLAYFATVIDEVLGLRVDDAYFQHLRQRLARFPQKP